MAAIVRAAVRGAARVPVTVKVRKGLDDGLLTFRDAGAVAEGEGAAAIGLHARTAAQLYAGRADWDAIAELKARVRIPVLGNGDVREASDALRMMRATGCDAVIVGRGCLGRPWLFADLAAVFDGRPPAPPPRLGAVVDVVRRHAAMLVDFFGPVNGIRHMRKWGTWYVAGFPGARAARAALTRIETPADLAAILDRFDPDETMHAEPRASRESRVQERVALPHGWLDARDDDAPPAMPTAAWDAAVSGG
jgi:nifR3 family TIM-barrel protein